MDDTLDLEKYIHHESMTVLLGMGAPVEGRITRAFKGGVPSGRYCIVGADGRFVKAGRAILTFAPEEVLLLMENGKAVYVGERRGGQEAK